MSQTNSQIGTATASALTEHEAQQLEATLQHRSRTDETANTDYATLRKDRSDYRWNATNLPGCEATTLKQDTYNSTLRALYEKYCGASTGGTDVNGSNHGGGGGFDLASEPSGLASSDVNTGIEGITPGTAGNEAAETASQGHGVGNVQ
ncbi:hypothetical protein I317_05350 [Kwoniella heveanensis CBS 569]|nr:hypothetical protein I317_05350 [Kwoniella heveanensis CBS 569]